MFGHSDPASGKTLRSLWLSAGLFLVALVIHLSLTPDPVTVPVDQGDKYSHVLAYLVLMLWFAQIYESGIARIRLAASLMLLGVALEFAQRWTGVRSFEVLDMAAGIAGVFTGWAMAPPRMPSGYLLVQNALSLLRRS